jgi:hypothetical protein
VRVTVGGVRVTVGGVIELRPVTVV